MKRSRRKKVTISFSSSSSTLRTLPRLPTAAAAAAAAATAVAAASVWSYARKVLDKGQTISDFEERNEFVLEAERQKFVRALNFGSILDDVDVD